MSHAVLMTARGQFLVAVDTHPGVPFWVPTQSRRNQHLRDGILGRVEMTPYDAKAWAAIQKWHEPVEPRWQLPASAGKAIAAGRTKVKAGVKAVPGSSIVLGAVQHALEGLLGPIDRVAAASVHTSAITDRYSKHGHRLEALADISALNLSDIDKVRPRVDLRYMIALGLEGAAAGLAVSGGEILAAGGAVAGAGAGAAPGLGLVVGATAADAVAVLLATSRVTAEIAAYYGVDVELPHERIYAAGVLGVGLASQAGKVAAYQELNKLVQALARNKTWEALNKNVMTQVIQAVYLAFGERITKQKLGQAVPGLGILIGAGMNARTLGQAIEAADMLYRERFLREKYGLHADNELPEGQPAGAVDIAEILDAEILDDTDETDETDGTDDR